jgi:hypothetical protein
MSSARSTSVSVLVSGAGWLGLRMRQGYGRWQWGRVGPLQDAESPPKRGATGAESRTTRNGHKGDIGRDGPQAAR